MMLYLSFCVYIAISVAGGGAAVANVGAVSFAIGSVDFKVSLDLISQVLWVFFPVAVVIYVFKSGSRVRGNTCISYFPVQHDLVCRNTCCVNLLSAAAFPSNLTEEKEIYDLASLSKKERETREVNKNKQTCYQAQPTIRNTPKTCLPMADIKWERECVVNNKKAKA